MEAVPVVEASRLKELLRKWLDESPVKAACAVGIRNYTKGCTLVNPRAFTFEGTTEHSPADSVEHGEGSACLFGQREYSKKGSAGCLCYDISDTEYMIAIMWASQLAAGKREENRFNIRCIKTGECNEALFKYLNETSRRADGEVVQEENGFRLCGCMGREPKSMLIIDVFESRHVGYVVPTEPVKSGRQLENRLREWIQQAEVKNACGIGINNLSSSVLVNPFFYIYSGTCAYEPANAVEPQMASASLFCKREYSLLGTSGLLTYDIKDTQNQVVVLWYIALSEALQENRFFAGVVHKTECNEALYMRIWKESRRARDGEMMRDEHSFQVFSRMESTPKAALIVSIRPKKQWSLW